MKFSKKINQMIYWINIKRQSSVSIF